jgi:tRNA wybutosine-synthesizing protein 2
MLSQRGDKGSVLPDSQPSGSRPRPPPPAARARAELEGTLPLAALATLPASWVRLGRVLVLPLAADLRPWWPAVAEAYARAIGCEAVVREAGPIAGALREPSRELVWGKGTETEVLEGGVRFAMDAARVMWSAGNVHERQRVPRLVQPGEVVVDLFAGIGYFAVPVAAKSKPARVHACELNPVAFHYLRRNAALNDVTAIIEARAGDCRTSAPRGVADRVLMGYTVDTEQFLPTALASLKPEGGALHYHEACPASLWRTRPWERVREAAAGAGRDAKLGAQRVVKNYAPGMVHVVVDAEVR